MAAEGVNRPGSGHDLTSMEDAARDDVFLASLDRNSLSTDQERVAALDYEHVLVEVVRVRSGDGGLAGGPKRHLASVCQGPPALLGWATGNLPEPKNNPQVGMVNMRTVMPALQKAKPGALPHDAVRYLSVTPPKQQRQTRIVKDRPAEEIVAEIAEWIVQE